MNRATYYGQSGVRSPFGSSGGGGGGGSVGSINELQKTNGAGGFLSALIKETDTAGTNPTFEYGNSKIRFLQSIDALSFLNSSGIYNVNMLLKAKDGTNPNFTISVFDDVLTSNLLITKNGASFSKTLSHAPATLPTESALLSQVPTLDYKVKTASGDASPNFLETKIIAGSNVTITKSGDSQRLTIAAAGGGFSENALLLGANVFNCNSMIGFSNRYVGIKVTALGSGIVNKLSCYVYNTYGARTIQMAIYDYTGAKLRETANTTLPAEQNKTVVLPFTDLSIVSGNQYWLVVQANGVDIPAFSSFAVYSATFPSGMHAIQNDSGSSLPPTINATYPNGTTSNTIPVNCFR